MATKIRLKRFGGKHDPHYRIVIADSRKKRDGRAVEELGYYCPADEPATLEINAERIEHWLGVGAQPTETVRSLLVKSGILEAPEGYQAPEDEVEAEAEKAAEAASEKEPEEAEEPDESPEAEETAEAEEELKAEEAEDAEDVEDEAPETDEA